VGKVIFSATGVTGVSLPSCDQPGQQLVVIWYHLVCCRRTACNSILVQGRFEAVRGHDRHDRAAAFALVARPMFSLDHMEITNFFAHPSLPGRLCMSGGAEQPRTSPGGVPPGSRMALVVLRCRGSSIDPAQGRPRTGTLPTSSLAARPLRATSKSKALHPAVNRRARPLPHGRPCFSRFFTSPGRPFPPGKL